MRLSCLSGQRSCHHVLWYHFLVYLVSVSFETPRLRSAQPLCHRYSSTNVHGCSDFYYVHFYQSNCTWPLLSPDTQCETNFIIIIIIIIITTTIRIGRSRNSLQWRHNERDGISNHLRLHCLLNRLFRCGPSKFRVTGLCEGSSTVTVELPAQTPVMRKMFPFDDVTLWSRNNSNSTKNTTTIVTIKWR